MNRVGDYIGFVVWFVGLGYIVLWLVAMIAEPILPPALHAVGLLAACLVAVRLLLLAHARRHASAAVPVVDARVPATSFECSGKAEARPLRSVKPRHHFGLRGTPH
jgi:hypothetical protein